MTDAWEGGAEVTNFAWWDRLVAETTGGFLCKVCYEGRTLEEAWTDKHGDKWDVCIHCQNPPAPSGDVEEAPF